VDRKRKNIKHGQRNKVETKNKGTMTNKNKIPNALLICKICGDVPAQKLDNPDKTPVIIKQICQTCKEKKTKE